MTGVATQTLPGEPSVKGWCPGALRPMQSGDGLVVRVRTGCIVTASLARAIADLARSYGNGLVDLTQRANLQLRGVTDQTWPKLIQHLSDLGVLDTDAEVEAVRNIIVSPLAGIDPTAKIDARGAAEQLATRISGDPIFWQLPGKFGFVIDDGGRLPLDDVASDIRFVGIEAGRVAVEIGDLHRIGVIPTAEIGDVAARLADVFLRLKGNDRRMAGVVARHGARAIAEGAGFNPSGLEHRRRRTGANPVGGFSEYVGVGVPFGRLTSEQLLGLADFADRHETGELRLTPWRSVLIPGVAADAGLDGLIKADLITSPDDARLAVVACSGAPACQSAAGPVRDDAIALAKLAAQLPGSGVRLHVSGCIKGCARPVATAITLVARENGYDFVKNGRTSDGPISTGLTRQAIESLLQSDLSAQSMSKPTLSQKPVSTRASYIRDGAEIYRHSFAIIRAEADLARFSKAEEPVAVRIIHASGMVEVAADIAFSAGAAEAARAALKAGAPIFADAEMVARGVTRARLPANNEVICTLTDPRVAGMAEAAGTTRSAAAMELWRDRLGGSVVAIGNAPTSLYRLLEMIDEGAPMPACVIGMPVGFVGAAESKDALMDYGRVPFIVVRGRKGGSAMAAATVNALASERE